MVMEEAEEVEGGAVDMEEEKGVIMEPPWPPPPLLPLDQYQGPLSYLCHRINLSALSSPSFKSTTSCADESEELVPPSFSLGSSLHSHCASSLSSAEVCCSTQASIDPNNAELIANPLSGNLSCSLHSSPQLGLSPSRLSPSPADALKLLDSSTSIVSPDSKAASSGDSKPEQSFSHVSPQSGPCNITAPLISDSNTISSAYPLLGLSASILLSTSATAVGGVNSSTCPLPDLRPAPDVDASLPESLCQFPPESNPLIVRPITFSSGVSCASSAYPHMELSSSFLLSTPADALTGVGSTSCKVVPNTIARSSLAQTISQLPDHLASFFADLTSEIVSSSSLVSDPQKLSCEPSTSAVMQSEAAISLSESPTSVLLDISSSAAIGPLIHSGTLSKSSGDFHSRTLVGSQSFLHSVTISSSSAYTPALTSEGSAPSDILLMHKSSALDDVAVSSSEPQGKEKALDKLGHNKSPCLEEKVSEVQVGDAIAGELEEGEVSGELEGDDDFVVEDAAVTSKISEEEEEGEDEGVVDYRTEGLTPVVSRFSVDKKLDRAFKGRSSVDHVGKRHKKNLKRRQGKAVIARQRKKTRTEEKEMGSLGPAQETNSSRRQQEGRNALSKKRMELCEDSGRKAGEKRERSGYKKVEIEKGPEEGEVTKKENKGLLSLLVEEEVGLWTTDIGDEQITSSQIENEGGEKKKARGPLTAERKAKKKMSFRRKRAQKEKEQGIVRHRMSTTVKPTIVLCRFFLKGRCTLGEECTFSHAGVPVTKSDPCKFFMIKRCLKGDDCPFSHELNLFPCKFWHTRGYCLDGDLCRFSHGPLTEEQRQNLIKRIEHDSKEQHALSDSPREMPLEEDSASDYMPTINPTSNDSSAWNIGPLQHLVREDNCLHTSTVNDSLQTPLQDSRKFRSTTQLDVPPEASPMEKPTEEAPANAVLQAARKAALAAAAQAAGTTGDRKLLSRSSPGLPLVRTSSPLIRSNSSGNTKWPATRGSEGSAMELLQASFGKTEEPTDGAQAKSSKSEILSSLLVDGLSSKTSEDNATKEGRYTPDSVLSAASEQVASITLQTNMSRRSPRERHLVGNLTHNSSSTMNRRLDIHASAMDVLLASIGSHAGLEVAKEVTNMEGSRTNVPSTIMSWNKGEGSKSEGMKPVNAPLESHKRSNSSEAGGCDQTQSSMGPNDFDRDLFVLKESVHVGTERLQHSSALKEHTVAKSVQSVGSPGRQTLLEASTVITLVTGTSGAIGETEKGTDSIDANESPSEEVGKVTAVYTRRRKVESLLSKALLE